VRPHGAILAALLAAALLLGRGGAPLLPDARLLRVRVGVRVGLRVGLRVRVMPSARLLLELGLDLGEPRRIARRLH
jgi:hypothetical protein